MYVSGELINILAHSRILTALFVLVDFFNISSPCLFLLAFFFMMFSVYGDTHACSVQEAPAAVAAVASTAAGSLASGLMHDVGS